MPWWHHAFDGDAFALQLRAADELRPGNHHVVVWVQADGELSVGEHGLKLETSLFPNATSFL